MKHVILSIGNSRQVKNLERITGDFQEKLADGSISMEASVIVSGDTLTADIARLYRAVVDNLQNKFKMILRVYFGSTSVSTEILDIVKGCHEFYMPDGMKVIKLEDRSPGGPTTGVEVLNQCLEKSGGNAKELQMIRFVDFEPSVSNLRNVNFGIGPDYFTEHVIQGIDEERITVFGDIDSYETFLEAATSTSQCELQSA